MGDDHPNREQRRQAREEQKRTGVKKKVPGSKKSPIDVDEEEPKTEQGEKGGKGKQPSTTPARGRGPKKSESTGSGRSRSVPGAKRTPKENRRSGSVDSSMSSRRGRKESSSDSDASGGKRKAESSAKTPKKTAKFKDDVINNEGKTASTKKHVKESKKKDKDKDSYAKKAEKEIKKSWIYSTIISYDTKVYKCNDVPREMYKRMSGVLATLQTYDLECAIGDHVNAKAEPIRSPGEFNWKTHVPWQRKFTVDWEPDWQWDKVTGDRPRSFKGSFILLSDKPPEEILKYTRVDLRTAFKGSIEIKPLQELHTNLDLILLGVHGNTNSDEVAKELRDGLRKVELDILNRKKLFDTEEEEIKESVFDSISYDWTKVDFPDILGVRSYPKQGPFEESKAGADTSWKLAQHFLMADQSIERVDVALAEFIKTGAAAKLFGKQAIIFRISEMTKGGKDEYNRLILKHQNTNRSVGSVTLPGAVNLEVEVAMYFEAEEEGKSKPFKMVSMRDIISRLYVKIGGRKIPVFLYVFKTGQGHYQFWFWDTVNEIRDYVNLFSSQGAAMMWHQCRKWGWQQGPLKRLFLASFDSTTAIGAMNSKWSAKKNRAIEIAVSSEAAAFLNFGNSPFILGEGESKDARKQKAKGVIQRGNLKPEDIGGTDVDDLESLGDTSNAQTVYQDEEAASEEEYSEEDDDDVSKLSEDEYEDESEDDEHTINKDYGEESDDEEMEEESYDDDHDSAFSTKAGLDDLKRGGRRVRRDSEANYIKRIQELEEEKRLAEEKMQARVKELEDNFNDNMAKVLSRLQSKEQEMDEAIKKMSADNQATPGATREDTQEGSNSPKDPSGSASAGAE